MRQFVLVVLGGLGLLAEPAAAADKPETGPPPAWVKPVSIPAPPVKGSDAAVSVLLADQQAALEPGRVTLYADTAIRIQTPEGLSAGNVTFAWRPDTDTPTVHKLVIHRGGQTIDVLASGQTFTVVRREPNLENATLDGVLTANIQPEGLQVGDVLEFAISISSSDPVLKGHVEQLAAAWNGAPVTHAHLRLQWPSSLPVRLRETIGLPALAPVTAGGSTSVELSLNDLQPITPPNGAPTRYAIGRLVEATDFKSWADIGALMAPLFAKAATVPAQGPLRTELDRIRQLSPDPKARAEAALQLVQERVRYVALVMGQGGLVPADAETTWSRRYGDCKAKTALLLALLHELGIQAEPVAVSTTGGDGLDSRLPMIGVFDHVLVRATIGGRTYWLDGARSGDASLDRLRTPNYHWGLPLVPAGAALTPMAAPPLDEPDQEMSLRIDASAGILAPAPAKAELTFRGDAAIGMKLLLANLVGEQRDRALRQYWRGQYDYIDITSTSADFDPKTGEERLSMTGVAHMDWSNGWFDTGMGVGYKADFHRDPGPYQDAPFAVAYPSFSRTTETIVMPAGFPLAEAGLRDDLNQTVAGVEYRRHSHLDGHAIVLEKTERSLAPEFPAKDAPAAERTLRQLADETVYLVRPKNYRVSEQDFQAMLAATPTNARGFLDRGGMLLNLGRIDEAFADFDRAVALEPKNAFALADRGIARVWKGAYADADKDLAAAAALDPKNLIVFRARALEAERRGDPQAAVAVYGQALAVDPSDAFALGGRARASYAAGDFDGALRDSTLALKVNPGWPEMRLLRANVFRDEGKTDEALAEAAALSSYAHSDWAQVAAANVYSALGRRAEALQAYDRALAIKPQAYIYLNRAQHRPLSDLAGRRADVDAALALDPKLAPAIAEKAAMQSEQGDAAGAIATYSKALEAAPKDPGLLAGRGVAYARSGDLAHAEADFAAARQAATEPVQLNNLCWAKATAGAVPKSVLESALADCDAALAKAPGFANFLDSRALVLLRLGRTDEAVADYDQALAKRPGLPSSLFGRAIAWSRKGDKARSTADETAALKADPDVKIRFVRYGLEP